MNDTLQLGPLRAHVAGEPGGATVVLLHGFGAPGHDLVPLASYLGLPSPVRAVFPEAPIALPAQMFGPGRAWWLIDFAAREAELAAGGLDLSREHPDGLAPAREALSAALDALIAEHDVDPERLVLGGFSQGAMLALDLALHDERPLAGLVLLSSTLLCADIWRARLPARAGLPVFQSHGRADPLLPYAMAERLAREMTAAGLEVELVSFAGGHEIPLPVLQAAGAAIRRWL